MGKIGTSLPGLINMVYTMQVFALTDIQCFVKNWDKTPSLSESETYACSQHDDENTINESIFLSDTIPVSLEASFRRECQQYLARRYQHVLSKNCLNSKAIIFLEISGNFELNLRF